MATEKDATIEQVEELFERTINPKQAKIKAIIHRMSDRGALMEADLEEFESCRGAA